MRDTFYNVSKLTAQFIDGRQFTLPELATEYGVTLRTVHRWLNGIGRVLPLERKLNQGGITVYYVRMTE